MRATPLKLLMVEDKAPVRAALAAALRARFPSCELLEAASLAQARRLVRDELPQVVVLDIGLPDGNGLDLLQDIRAVRPEAFVAVWTSHETPEHREAARRCGADCFLTKTPPDWERLYSILAARPYP